MIKKLSIIIFFVFSFCGVYAQSTAAEVLANKIAQRMKDSLGLTQSQAGSIYQVNMQLSNNKAAIRQQYAGSDSLGIRIQAVETMRDSLYHAVLPYDKFLLYRQKKRTLVNNN